MREKIYEGSSKTFYRGISADTMIIKFNSNYSDARYKISKFFWKHLSYLNISNHFIRELTSNEQLIRSVQAPNVFIRVHTMALSEIACRLGIEMGLRFDHLLCEWHLKSRQLQNPFISENHLLCFNILSKEQIHSVIHICTKVMDIMKSILYFYKIIPGFIELHFGFLNDGSICLTNEISPETLGLYDITQEKELETEKRYAIMAKVLQAL